MAFLSIEKACCLLLISGEVQILHRSLVLLVYSVLSVLVYSRSYGKGCSHLHRLANQLSLPPFLSPRRILKLASTAELTLRM